MFNQLNFNVNSTIFFELLQNPDKGFGFTAQLEKSDLSQLQIETFDYLIRCQEKKLLGNVSIVFTTDDVGDITHITRNVEKIEFNNDKYIISNTY